ncbi:MAG: MFS transporter permease [Gammaproteobacteria bacterium BRH_c0]|nr:MAG: MFS transporter permease [Gammaproteobacteria bacterium BRH_c0]
MTDPEKKSWDTRYEWRAVALLSIGFGLVGLDRFMIQPLFPVMMKDLNLDYQDIGLISGILAMTWGISAIFSGRLADRIGHRIVLIPAVIIFSLLAGVSGLAVGLISLLLIRALMGFAEGAFTPVSIVATLDASKPSRHGLNLGIQQNMVALVGLGLAPLIVTQLLAVVPSWRWVFVLVSLPGFIVAYLMYKVIRNPSPQAAAAHTQTHDATPHRWQDVFKYRNVPLNICGMFCWLTVVTVMGAFMPSYLMDHLGLSLGEMGFVMSAIGFGGSAGNLVLPGLSDKFGRRPVLAFGVIVAVCALLTLRTVGNDPGLLFALVFIVMFCVFSNVTLTVGPLTVESVPATLMATASGLVVGIGEVFGGGIVPAVAGFVAQNYGIQHILTLAAGGMSLGLIVVVFLRETAPVKQGR